MKKQKNIFQLEVENDILKQKLISLQLNKEFNFDKTKFSGDFLTNFNYLEQLINLILEYDYNAYLIYIKFFEKENQNLNLYEIENELNFIISKTINPFSPSFIFENGIIIFSFASSTSEIKAKSNLFLYEFNQSIFSSMIEALTYIFSIKTCLENKPEDKTFKEYFLYKFFSLHKGKFDEFSKVILVNINENYEVPEVFLVEPDAFNAAIVIDILKNNSINCIWFRDGQQAYERIKSSKPICIISEIAVAGLSGFEIRQKLIEDEINIPVIILSSQKNEDLLKTASLLGINYFIKKPYYINELLSAIRNYISSNI